VYLFLWDSKALDKKRIAGQPNTILASARGLLAARLKGAFASILRSVTGGPV